MPAIGKTQRTILLLLAAGGALLLSRSPRRSFRIISEVQRELRKLRADALRESIRRLYESHLIDSRDLPGGETRITLNNDGKRYVLKYRLDDMRIVRPKSWDQKWRLILFDVPEKRRPVRDALRRHFRQLGCIELQKSAFIHPFDCQNEIDFLIEFFQARRFVRFLVVEQIDNALHLRAKFHI
ncbi:MAG: hypothetical protein HY474_02365 [Candidatus Sungbacteria bacterium]|uniref:Transcriptional repressor PaaX-like central Cas2-like domain-containing protein n=1 Tax=Candidatus Sungiibacteriota bacterium TaxID=2750080 RepID=A0A932YW19_9BACT|nr:hypothetical protein [Candidatus Sungbacteria bacterium]